MGQKYRPNYWKNAALLTGSDVVLRLAGHGAAHRAGQRAGRRGHGPVPAGAGGVWAVRHAGYGGHLGGGHPPAHRGAEPGRGVGPGHAAASAGAGGRAGGAGHGGTGGPCGAGGQMVAGGCAGGGRAAAVGAGPAVDGRVGGAAGVLSGPAAGWPQRGQPAGRADGAHRGGGGGPVRHTGPGCRGALHAGAGGHRPERGGELHPHGPVLPAARPGGASAGSGRKRPRRPPAACGTSCGRWRAAGCWPARCTRQRTCWCPPAWPST